MLREKIVETLRDFDEIRQIGRIADALEKTIGEFAVAIDPGSSAPPVIVHLMPVAQEAPASPAPAQHLRGDEAEWIKTCTTKISNAIGGGSELFTRHGDQYRLDIDLICDRIQEMRNRQHEAMHRAIRAERKAGCSDNG